MSQTQPLSASGRPLSPHWLSIIVLIWVGQAVSIVTSYAASFAAVWYVTETTGSALMLALMSICAYLPQGLLSPVGGVVADRFNRKVVLIVADFTVGLVSLVMGFVILMGDLSIGAILVLVVARSAGQAFHSPAMMATMPMLVPEKHLLRINTIDQLLLSLVGVGAPALGITLYTVLGFHTVMFLDFAGACIACLALLPARIPSTWKGATADGEPTAEHHGVLAEVRAGWQALASNRGLLMLVGLLTLVMVGFGPTGSLYPLMTYSHFGGDGYMASVAEAVFAGGMLVGSTILMAWGGGKRLVLLIAGASVIFGLLCLVAGLLPSSMFWAFVVLCAGMGFVCAYFNGPMVTLVQRSVSEEKMGRVLGFVTMAMGLATPVGIAIGGVAAEAIGVAPFFAIDGLICAVLGVVLYLPRSVRALDGE